MYYAVRFINAQKGGTRKQGKNLRSGKSPVVPTARKVRLSVGKRRQRDTARTESPRDGTACRFLFLLRPDFFLFLANLGLEAGFLLFARGRRFLLRRSAGLRRSRRLDRRLLLGRKSRGRRHA